MDMDIEDISPYLAAVQHLRGDRPSEKFRELHRIAEEILEADERERNDLVNDGKTNRVLEPLKPYLRIVVGNKLQSGECVVEALKSNDVTIVKQALGAHWFFKSSSPLMEATNFTTNVVPKVSMRTRLELMKTLAHCLQDDSRKAEYFFGSFANDYGVEQTLPLLVVCDAEYIYEAVIRRRIILPKRILTALYHRKITGEEEIYKNLVVRYLQLGNPRCHKNQADRNLHKINLANYARFLPVLVKENPLSFVELFQCLRSCDRKIKLGSTRAEYFLKHAVTVLIARPKTFLDILPLKLVSNKLSTQQFDEMFKNLLCEEVRKFSFSSVMKYLKYYPREKRIPLLAKVYEDRYNIKLLKDSKTIFSEKEVFKLLPLKSEDQENQVQEFVNSYKDKLEYFDYVHLLPPVKSIPLLQTKIAKTPNPEARSRYIEHMIHSCSVYNDKDSLLTVLKYYTDRHKNEQKIVLQQVLGFLVQSVDIAKLGSSHWEVLNQIIQRAYIKGDLNDAPPYTYEALFSGALRYYIKRCQEANVEENTTQLDRVVRMIIELFLERNMKWGFILESPDVGRDCLTKFLQIIPQMYPGDDAIWNNDNKMSLATYLIRAMQGLNEIGEVRKRKHKKTTATTSDDSMEGRPQPEKFAVGNYPWLTDLVYSLLKSRNPRNTSQQRQALRRFTKLLLQHDAELYQSLIDRDEKLINDVESEDAILLLKSRYDKVLLKWNEYLKACRHSVQSTRRSTQRFIIWTKWYKELPVLFAKKCVAELEVKGSALILGLLLEGEAMKEIIKPYVPKTTKIALDTDDGKRLFEIIKSVPKAMNLANPPLPLDLLLLFCQGEYIHWALQSLMNAMQRTPVPEVLEFVNNKQRKPITVKKQAIRLTFQVATRNDSRDYLRSIWSNESDTSVRAVLAKTILDLFKKSPGQDTWALLKDCIQGLVVDDRDIFSLFVKRVKDFDTNYVALYLKEFIKKIDSFTKEQFEEQARLEHFQNIICSINSELIQHLSDELMYNIVKRYPLQYTVSFTIGVYLFSDERKFETNLAYLIEILLHELQFFNVPAEEVPRCCPKNREVREFFIEVARYVYRRNSEAPSPLHLRLVKEMLSLFTSLLRPRNEPRSYILLRLCKEWLTVKSPERFGEKFVQIAQHMVDQFGSELILTLFSDVLLSEVLQNEHCYRGLPKVDCKLTAIESMMKKDMRIGSLIGIKMLSHYEATKYDDRYDEFMNIWKASQDPMVQSLLSEFVNTSNPMYHGAYKSAQLRYLNLH